jgi:hypothetical protein
MGGRKFCYNDCRFSLWSDKIFDGAVLFTCTAMSLANVSGSAEGGVSGIFFPLSIGPAQAASP